MSILFRVQVEGESCWPELITGKSYWASCLPKPQTGDFVVFRNPLNYGQIFVKKVVATEGGKYCVAGTVSWGASSADFGWVDEKLILGRILRRNSFVIN